MQHQQQQIQAFLEHQFSYQKAESTTLTLWIWWSPYLGTDVLSWYLEFKHTLGDHPHSAFVFKRLSRLYDLRSSGTQQPYTSKFMLLLSQSSLELHEMVKRWFYHPYSHQIKCAHILQETIEHVQRFEVTRKHMTSRFL
ncbi:hypothetical protein PHMEG_0008761 [Phytophthora megakarya]|uniref:Retrotransposon gag domain-containing protein n=1 Tax=Phytophthora megakarya TaxID=4795 RepID=A0A225WI68_9STRA|nr:hypothetical protein PHMEG_0008761 [Phytophthora megakarya]